jgi:predicted nucleotide-binding protein
MSPKVTNTPGEERPPGRRVAPEVLREEVQALIKEGETVLPKAVGTDEIFAVAQTVDDARRALERWAKKARLVLVGRLFDRAGVADEFDEKGYVLVMGSPDDTPGKQALRLQREVAEKLNFLQAVVECADIYPPASSTSVTAGPSVEPANQAPRPAEEQGQVIFVVHGRSEIRERVVRFLERVTTAGKVIVLDEEPNRGRSLIEKFEQEAGTATFAVVIMTADDQGGLKGARSQMRLRPRQNVVFELGYFFGRLGRRHVAVLMDEQRDFERPTDVDGLVYIPLDAAEGWKIKLATELRAGGVTVDLNKA